MEQLNVDTDRVTRFLDSLQPAFQTGDHLVEGKHYETNCMRLLELQYRALVRFDLPAFREMLAEDTEMIIVGPASIPIVGHWKGRDAVIEAIVKNFSYMTNQQPEILSVVAQGNTVVLTAHERGLYLPTGREYETHWVQHFTWHNDHLIKSFQIFDGSSFLVPN